MGRFVRHLQSFKHVLFALALDALTLGANLDKAVIRQRKPFGQSMLTHLPVEKVASREVKQCEAILALRVNFDVNSSVVLVSWGFANTHVHFTALVTHTCVAKTLLQESLFFKPNQDRFQHIMNWLVVRASHQDIDITAGRLSTSVRATSLDFYQLTVQFNESFLNNLRDVCSGVTRHAKLKIVKVL